MYFKIKWTNFSVLVKRVKMSAILQSIPACFENCMCQKVEQTTEESSNRKVSIKHIYAMSAFELITYH